MGTQLYTRSLFTIVAMLLAAILVVLLSVIAGSYDSDFTPDSPTVEEELTHSAYITVDTDDVPAGTTRVHIQAKELDDLTGNSFETGYEFGYSSDVPHFYYPELNEGNYHVFRVQYGNTNGNYTQYSEESRYSHADSSRLHLVAVERNWDEAKEYCVSEDKRLAVVHSQAVNDQLKALIDAEGLDNLWIGLYDKHYNDESQTTTWVWVDSTKYNYNNFEAGTSDESTLDTAAVSINSVGEWETHDPNDKKKFFCEDQKSASLDKRTESMEGINLEEDS